MTAHICDLTPNTPPALGELGGPCVCGRGETLGTCHWTSGRIWLRAFHDGPAAFHLGNAADWACLECVADKALAVTSGKVRPARAAAAKDPATPPPDPPTPVEEPPAPTSARRHLRAVANTH